MDEVLTHDGKRTKFVWGAVLTGALSIPLLVGMAHAFRGISAEKATGLAAVAGSLAESYLMFGIVVAFALPIAAIILLSRSFVPGHGVRSLFSLLGICWNALIVVFAGVSLWLYLVYAQRH